MKKYLGAVNSLYPMPVVLAGAMLNGRPNYITIAHVGIFTLSAVSLGIHKSHYTNAGIREHGEFSINIPSERLVAETDYCGIMTGKNTDKSALFTNFFGELKNAPLIAECPVNMECRLVQTVDMGTHEVFVGEVTATHCDEDILTDGRVDLTKLKPMLFDMAVKKYFRLGGPFADCWGAGKALKKK